MHTRQRPYRLFEAHGIELEYMVVDRDTLDVRPLVAQLFTDVVGSPVADVPRGTMEWSNELTDHVVEVRNAKPARRIAPLRKRFAAEVKALDKALAKHNAMLLPGGAHPWMDPKRETVLWAHEHSDVYRTFDRLFGCQTHGWANTQSTHLNLSFAGDPEFTRLHAAVRLLLPIIPAIAASSPILDGRPTGFLDARMEAYLHAQERMPEMMGSLIPEAVFNEEEYYREIYSPIAQVLARHDAVVQLQHEFANTRGAVARFDRGSVEIRVIDAQECPAADLAIAEFITVVLKALASGRWVSTYLQRAWPESDLLAIFLQVIKDAGTTMIANRDYLLMFGLMKEERMSAAKLWQHLFVELYEELSEDARQHIGSILEHGCLASRILKHTGRSPSREKLRTVYRELGSCLLEDRLFL
ncbi:MAG: glutamate--cysteine ligase [Flavobacteriales bacterium]|nr:glutamate--cysteine ligase [Flavobacteriales bacterium]